MSVLQKRVTGRSKLRLLKQAEADGMGLIFRHGTIDDLGAVFQLNRDSFTESWSFDGLKNALEGGYELLLCMDRELLVGYLLSQNVLDEVHIMQVAIAPPYRRKGVAEQLSRQLLDTKRDRKLLLEVRASNLAAQALYAKLGFTKAGNRKAYYVAEGEDAVREDAVLMSCQNS